MSRCALHNINMKMAMKARAVRLRANGWSYTDIQKRLGVSKSTLSGWLKAVPYEPNAIVRGRMRNGPIKSIISRNKLKVAEIAVIKNQAVVEVGTLSERDLFMLGVGLYMGEGAKVYEQVQVINADPKLIKLAVEWFETCCGLTEDNFRIKLHIYPDNSEASAKNYWSKVTGIPKSQFTKTQIDIREKKRTLKKRKLPYGTAHLTVVANGDKSKGVVLHRRIIGWIEAINSKMRV